MFKKVICAGFILFVVSEVNAASKLELNVGVGVMNSMGSLSGNEGASSTHFSGADVKGGAGITTSLFYWFGKRFALGLEGGYTPAVEITETYDENVGSPFGVVQLEGSSTKPMVHVVPGIKIGSQPSVEDKKPGFYVFFGVGTYIRDQDTSMTLRGSKTVGGSSINIERTRFAGYSIDSMGVIPGFGVSFPISPRVEFGIDVRYHILNQDGIKFLNPSLRLSF